MRSVRSPARSKLGRIAVVGALAVSVTSITSIARAADQKQACIAASEQAQRLRGAGKLSEAREQLGICSRAECPKLVQQDCTQWMSEVLDSMPSVVPGAKDGKGRDIIDVRLSIDGKVATEKLDGKPIVIDPGVHTFSFETEGAPAITDQVVVKPGEKNRLVAVTFAFPDDAPAAPTATTAEPSSSSPPIAAFIVGGVGVVAGAVALAIDLGASGDAHDLRASGCAPRCAQSDVDDIQTRYTIAGVTAGIAGALVITGVVMFILHQRGEGAQGSASTASLWLRRGSGEASGPSTVWRF